MTAKEYLNKIAPEAKMDSEQEALDSLIDSHRRLRSWNAE